MTPFLCKVGKFWFLKKYILNSKWAPTKQSWLTMYVKFSKTMKYRKIGIVRCRQTQILYQKTPIDTNIKLKTLTPKNTPISKDTITKKPPKKHGYKKHKYQHTNINMDTNIKRITYISPHIFLLRRIEWSYKNVIDIIFLIFFCTYLEIWSYTEKMLSVHLHTECKLRKMNSISLNAWYICVLLMNRMS